MARAVFDDAKKAPSDVKSAFQDVKLRSSGGVPKTEPVAAVLPPTRTVDIKPASTIVDNKPKVLAATESPKTGGVKTWAKVEGAKPLTGLANKTDASRQSFGAPVKDVKPSQSWIKPEQKPELGTLSRQAVGASKSSLSQHEEKTAL